MSLYCDHFFLAFSGLKIHISHIFVIADTKRCRCLRKAWMLLYTASIKKMQVRQTRRPLHMWKAVNVRFKPLYTNCDTNLWRETRENEFMKTFRHAAAKDVGYIEKESFTLKLHHVWCVSLQCKILKNRHYSKKIWGSFKIFALCVKLLMANYQIKKYFFAWKNIHTA